MFNDLKLMIKIIRNVHEQFFCAHSNKNRIEKLIQRYYYCFNMREIIKRFINNCYVCQKIKFTKNIKHDLLTFLLISQQFWIDISFDFVIKLFDCDNKNVICIIINRLIKKRYYVSYHWNDDEINVKITINILLYYVIRTHKFLFFILFDRNVQFVNTIWKRFCERLCINNKMFTIFYSKIDD